tara:strand:+ start:547 stop:753 length:207 start_codon:yes stop_codon:yes gene_type:complete
MFKSSKMKVGDLIAVVDERKMGGIPNGTLGLVVETLIAHETWRVQWIYAGHEWIETTFGKGAEIVNEA